MNPMCTAIAPKVIENKKKKVYSKILREYVNANNFVNLK